MIEKNYIKIKSRVTALKAQNKKVLYIIKIQVEKIKALKGEIKILIVKAEPNLNPRYNIILVTLIRPITTLIYRNKERIINKVVNAFKTLINYI